MSVDSLIGELLVTIDSLLNSLNHCYDVQDIKSVLEHSVSVINNVRTNISYLTSSTLYETKLNIVNQEVKEEIFEDQLNDNNKSQSRIEESNVNQDLNEKEEDFDDSDEEPVKISISSLNKVYKRKDRKKANNGYKKCGICPKMILNSKHSSHLKEKHMKDGQYFCYLCEFYSEDSKIMINHVSDKHRPTFMCTHCTESFKMIIDLKRHLDENHGVKYKNNICLFCDKIFDNTAKATKHINNNHNSNMPECHQCGKVFKTPICLTEHIKMKHKVTEKFTCHICGTEYVIKQGLENHMAVAHSNSPPTMPCPDCGALFYTRIQLLAHCRKHLEKSLLCSQCDFRTNTKSNLVKHMRSHSDERPYQCPNCQLSFKTPHHLARHQNNVHIGERDHICNFCSKGFKTSSALKEHVKLHTGDYAATCKICNKNFAQNGNYKMHMMKSHGELS